MAGAIGWSAVDVPLASGGRARSSLLVQVLDMDVDLGPDTGPVDLGPDTGLIDLGADVGPPDLGTGAERSPLVIANAAREVALRRADREPRAARAEDRAGGPIDEPHSDPVVACAVDRERAIEAGWLLG